MIRINENFGHLQKNYLFSEIAKRVAQFSATHGGEGVIKLGIGDVVLPLAPSIVEAWRQAVDEMGSTRGFRGYGPEQGYAFLREAIAEHDYRQRDVDLSSDEIFISDGAKCDSANIQQLVDSVARVAIPNPVYPVYFDSNVLAGRAAHISFLTGTRDNHFVPSPAGEYDLIYLCYPNNPTGMAATRSELQAWVEYAHAHKALIIFDGAYERFISSADIPHSIYEIPRAREVAIEVRSFSKSAGFTGVRCAYTVVPQECRGFDAHGEAVLLHALWLRRCGSAFNGVSYPVQRAAQATFSAVGSKQCAEQAQSYMRNAAHIRASLDTAGYRYFGGCDAPYIWVECGAHISSWQLFDRLLHEARVVVTPGAGFGSAGEGYIRISAFNTTDAVREACARIIPVLRNL